MSADERAYELQPGWRGRAAPPPTNLGGCCHGVTWPRCVLPWPRGCRTPTARAHALPSLMRIRRGSPRGRLRAAQLFPAHRSGVESLSAQITALRCRPL
jgi:hypothetical protein